MLRPPACSKWGQRHQSGAGAARLLPKKPLGPSRSKAGLRPMPRRRRWVRGRKNARPCAAQPAPPAGPLAAGQGISYAGATAFATRWAFANRDPGVVALHPKLRKVGSIPRPRKAENAREPQAMPGALSPPRTLGASPLLRVSVFAFAGQAGGLRSSRTVRAGATLSISGPAAKKRRKLQPYDD
jgi:hypothetical protein